MLRVAEDLALPIDAATQKLAYLGRTGSGKTFATKRMVEQMLKAGVQVVILDGSGGWAGLRLGPKAFKIPVLGGLYGDISAATGTFGTYLSRLRGLELIEGKSEITISGELTG